MNETLKVGETTHLDHAWSSANEAVATVDQDGVVTAVSPGMVEIYCTVRGLSAVTVIRVDKAPEPEPEPAEEEGV